MVFAFDKFKSGNEHTGVVEVLKEKNKKIE
jgi:hypothetical protein